MHILALDIGTTSMRGILYDENFQVLTVQSVQTPSLVGSTAEIIEQAPEVYLKGITSICKEVSANFKVDAIALTAFRSALTMVDHDGNALRNFIMWQDTRNEEICRNLEAANRWIYPSCGAMVNTVFTGTKLMWIHKNEPDIYRKAYKAVIVPDYILHFMTGEFKTDRTYGSRTLLMDIQTLNWSKDLLRLMCLDENKLCELIQQGSIAGCTQHSFARLTGIAEGTPVISAGGDQQCSALGLGVMDDRTLEVNSGTGSFVISISDKPVLDKMEIICNVAAIPGKYIQEANVISCASALNWLVREYFPECCSGQHIDYSQINAIAEHTPVGANGLYLVPHFQGCGSRDWSPKALACFYGFSLSSHREDMIRAFYEGIAAEIAKSIEVLSQMNRRSKCIVVAGGLSSSDIYNQILSDMTSRTVICNVESIEATALGACISATVALGVYPDYHLAYERAQRDKERKCYHPNPQNAMFYADYINRTEVIYRVLRNLAPEKY